MLGKSKQALKQTVDATPSDLIPWLESVVNQPVRKLQVKLRGNILHVLCESEAALDREHLLLRLVRALLEEATQSRLNQEFPQIYQIYFYSRQRDQKQPDWSAPIYLNRLDRHLEQLVAVSSHADEIRETAAAITSAQGIGQLNEAVSAIVLSNVSLARRGDPDAIARYLSETLSALDVGVDVKVRALPGKARRSRTVMARRVGNQPVSVDPAADLINRLWIFCKAHYSPDPSLIAQPTARRLRDLQLTQFHDAVITIQVIGEELPDWRLRVDLTPANEILKEWARWGDQEALTRLLNQALAPLAVRVTSEFKDSTLHLVCRSRPGSPAPLTPEPSEIIEVIAHLLDQLGPQGIHRAMVYGSSGDSINPDWLKCLELPAAEHAALAIPTARLARQGDLPAIAYCLTRLLNPDLDQQLATGGIRVQLLVKGKLLHVMTDGALCPSRQAVAQPVVKYLRKYRLKGIDGLRIYGRRSGQKQPAWNYGFDFLAKKRLVPEPTPEFAASDTYIEDLLTPLSEAPLRAELNRGTVIGLVREASHQATDILRQLLLHTQFFVTDDEANLPLSDPQLPVLNLAHKRIAAVWGLVGLLLALQIDWVVGQLLHPTQRKAIAEVVESVTNAGNDNDPTITFEEELAQLNWGKSTADSNDTFLSEETLPEAEVVSSAINDADLIGSPPQEFVSVSSLLAASPYPSFRSEQLDEKLALYHQRVSEEGPPDVLVLGSSRALRGIDPSALRQALSAMGYRDVSIFNFGVNGSTAQVVDLVVRRLIQPYPAPQLILWADGARAFNSGREDITFNGIQVSEGYDKLQEGTLFPASLMADSDESIPEAVDPIPANVTEQIKAYYQEADQQLSQALGQPSATYEDREAFKTLLRQGLSGALNQLVPDWLNPASEDSRPPEAMLPTETDLMDFDGFLPLSVQFNPATYYQNHARVAGDYDSDYKNFELEGIQTRAMQQLLDYTQAQQIPLVFVNTPLTDEYLDPARNAAEQAFQRYMLSLATQESGFYYRDLGQLWPHRYDYFSDPSHLNRYGAYQVSNRLAQDPMIPWSQIN
jgi:hypothetical protein